ncbi:MAG: two-component sensor histidine kinase [Desulfobacteraceae bacterium]|nr:two-component sensor histidine kinase [Desulfobacteraceae bacterium]
MFSIEKSINNDLKKIFLYRALFAIILVFSTFLFCVGKGIPLLTQPFVSLYIISILIFISSFIYTVLINRGVQTSSLIYSWAVVETFFVTAIIYVTGSFESIFTFLYLIVIICSSIFVFYKGSLIIATVSSLQYCIVAGLDYFGILNIFTNTLYQASAYNQGYIIAKTIIVVVACYAIALLSGMLALSAKNAKHDLKVTQGHLRRVERMAAVEEVLSGITHEIKNPLASLSGSIQLLKENAEPRSSDYRLMQIVLRETQRLHSIVNDFRLFVKPETTDAIVLKLDVIIAEIIELFLNAPEYNDNIKVVTRLDNNINIKIDPIHFKQIMWNLLTNAAQAMESAGEIQVILEQPAKDRVYLNIIDTGCGIEEKNIDSIFDPFFTTREEGTGLGLSIVHKLVDNYRGIVDCESVPGSGTVFTVIFKGHIEHS